MLKLFMIGIKIKIKIKKKTRQASLVAGYIN